MQQAIIDFISHLRIEAKYSQNTISAYAFDLKKWLIFFEQKQINAWDKLDSKFIEQYLMTLRSQAISVSTMGRRLSALRLFFGYLLACHEVKHDPSKQIKSPKLKQVVLPKVISYEQIDNLLKPGKDDLLSLRNRTIIALFYACGIRLSELTQLNINDIDFPSHYIKVLGKGNKERFIPVGQETINQLKVYLEKRIMYDNEALFITKKNSRLTQRMVQYIVKNIAIRSGLNQHLHPHMLRHSSATHFLQSSHDLATVQKFLGHDSIKSTQRYTHLDYQALAKVYDHCHPRAKLRKK